PIDIVGPGTNPVMTVGLNHLAITAGNAGGGDGGAISSIGATLNVSNSTITNSAARPGGGIFFDGNLNNPFGVLDVTGSTISGNTANGGTSTGFGGGVEAVHVFYDAIIDHSTVSGNTATADGGGVYMRTSDITSSPEITSSTISNNTAAG